MEKNFLENKGGTSFTKLNLDYNKTFSHDIKKCDYTIILPSSGTIENLNKQGDISFKVAQTAEPLDISNARLFYSVELLKEDGTAALEDATNITLENNFFPNLFSNMKLKIASYEVENINNPGIYSSMLNFVSFKKEYGEISGWVPDDSIYSFSQAANNKVTGKFVNVGYINRKELYKKKFTGFFELKYLFGFLQNYNRLIHNTYIELSLTRYIDDKLIFYGADNTTAKLKLTNLELQIPALTLNPRSEVSLIDRLKTNKPIYVDYLNRINSEHVIPEGTFYSTTIGNLAYRPRYIIIGFKNPNIEFNINNAKFIQKQDVGNPAVVNKLKSIQIRLNNTYYPINPIQFDATQNNIALPYEEYVKLCKKFKTDPQLNARDWKDLYSIFCIDTSDQDDNLAINSVNASVILNKDTNFKPRMYVLILEECKIKMNVNGMQISVIEPIRGNAI